MGQIKQTVNALKCRLPKRINYQALHAFAASEGWRVVTFGDGSKGDLLIASCGLSEYAETVESFAYQDDKKAMKFIAIRGDIGIDTRRCLLAHELGHIMLGHSLGETSVEEENEANDFVDKLLGIRRQKNKKKAICIVLAGILAIAITLALVFCIPRAPQDIDNPRIDDAEAVYITSDGDCYHNKDCIFVLGKSNVIQISIVDALVLGMRPCSVCRGE